MDRVTEWRKSCDGSTYRVHYTEGKLPPDGNYWVEWKPREFKLPKFPLLSFVVHVRKEVWPVKAKDAEAAAKPFWSESQPGCLRRKDVTVEAL